MELPLFPLNAVLFPGMKLSLHIFEERYKLMIDRCLEGDRIFGISLIKLGSEVGDPAVPYSVGTTAQIVHVERLDEGQMDILTNGGQRFEILDMIQERPYLVGRVQLLVDEPSDALKTEHLADSVRGLFKNYLTYLMKVIDVPLKQQLFFLLDIKGNLADELQFPLDSTALSHLVGSGLQVIPQEKQQLLEAVSTESMLQMEQAILERENKRLEAILSQRRKSEKEILDKLLGSEYFSRS